MFTTFLPAAKAPLGRVALVHDWLVAQRGGENVLLELARLFPQAPIYTLVHQAGRVHADIEAHRIITSPIAWLPGAPQHFRAYLPLFFAAVQAWDLSAYDLIISTSHCVAKGVRLAPGQIHVAYIHTPARYLWDEMATYLPSGRLGRACAPLLQPLLQPVVAPLRRWDQRAAQRPTQLLANSAFVAARIRRVWQRGASVVYPPVDVGYFQATPVVPATQRHGYVCVSALVAYKRLDAAIALANAQHLPLTIVGEGPQRRSLQRLAGPTVRFVASLSRAALRQAYAHAKGLLFCGSEDFGMAPVEAMAAGCPVLALRRGGLQETVVGANPAGVSSVAPTGVFFEQADLPSMQRAWRTFEQLSAAGVFQTQVLQSRAQLFSRGSFLARWRAILAAHGFTRQPEDTTVAPRRAGRNALKSA